MRPQVKRTIIISIVLILLGLGIAGASVYVFYMEGVQGAEQEIEALQDTREAYRKKQAQIPQMEEQRKQADVRAKQAEIQIPDHRAESLEDFQRVLNTIAANTRVLLPQEPKFLTARPGGPGARPIPPEIAQHSVEAQVEGNYFAVMEFISVIESMIRYVRVDNFTVTRGKEKSEGPEKEEKVTATLALNTYTWKTPESPQAAAPPGRVEPTPQKALTTPPLE